MGIASSVPRTVSVPKRPLGFCSRPSPAFHPLGYEKLLVVVQLSTSAQKALQELKHSSWKQHQPKTLYSNLDRVFKSSPLSS